MKNIILAGLLSLVPAATFACEGENHAEAGIKKVTVAQLAKDNQAKIFDANNDSFRAKNGVIPGAILLTSSSSYDLSVLPKKKDAPIVFYCSNTMCNASEGAAQRAVEAGHTNVAVLPDGLKGWKAAGQKTASVKPAT